MFPQYLNPAPILFIWIFIDYQIHLKIMENIKIDDKTYSILLRLLQNRTGLNLQYYRRNHIEKRIMSRMIRLNFNKLDAYYNYLFTDEGEFKKFIDSFNINYTFFFRDWEVYEIFHQIILKCLDLKKDGIISHIQPAPSQLKKFRTKGNYLKNKAKNQLNKLPDISSTIIPYMDMLSLKKKVKTRRRINIWSCACASGEEPYTIAMILDNISKGVSNFPPFNIEASDIDQDAILSALTGLYHEDSMKEITDYYKKKYYKIIQSKVGEQYMISDELKKYVEFINEDITKRAQKSLRYDVILCRYLLIYFNMLNRESFIKIIENQLNYGGLLILGRTETLFNKIDTLKLIDNQNQIYIKYK